MRKFLAFLAFAASTSMIFFDSSALSVALPTIQYQLGASAVGVQWMVNAYLLSLAAFVIAGGRAADIFGHRRFFSIGMVVFACASASCGVAMNEKWLIISRCVQGIGGAIMGPAAMTLLLGTYPPNQRGRVIGLLVSVSSLFLALGQFLGGFLTEMFSWRYIFFINLPIAALGICFAYFSIPPSPRTKEPFDFPSFFFLVASLGFFTVVIMMGRDWGWNSPQEVLCIVCGVCSVIFLFIAVQTRSHPIMDFSLTRSVVFFGGLTVIFLAQFLITFTIFSAMFFQQALMLSPLEAGIITAITTIPIFFLAPLSGYLSDTFGPRIPISIGFFLIMTGLLWIAFSTSTIIVHYYIPGFASFGAGIALIMTPAGSVTTSVIPPEKRGVAMGMYNTSRYVGGTLGVAILGSTFSSCHGRGFQKALSVHSISQSITSENFLNIATLPESESFLIKHSFITSYCEAFSLIATISAVIALVALSIALYSFTPRRLQIKSN